MNCLNQNLKKQRTANVARIFAPTGLNIGARSIVSEIRAVFSNRDGAFLRLRPASIHER